MNDLYGGECPHCGQHEIVRAIRVVLDFLRDDEFLDYCKGTALLDEEGEDIFGAVVRLQRFADELEHHMRPKDLEEGFQGYMRPVGLGGHSAGED